MQSKLVNAYRITHKNGKIEDINATSLVQALENMEVPESESAIIQTFLMKEGVRTLIEDEPTEVTFTAIVAENGGGSIATPATGRIHVGDMVQMKAVPARGYEFVSWSLNGEEISKDETINLVMPEPLEGIDTAVFTATFKLSDISWRTEVEPSEASTAGCVSFPASGVSEANAEASFIAVAKGGFTFDHWELNGESISTNELLTTTVTPLSDGEAERVYKAVFISE